MFEQIVYMVGAYNNSCMGWGIAGIYTNKDKAIDICEDSDHFLVPIILDKDIDDQTFLWYNGLQRPNFVKPKENGEEK